MSICTVDKQDYTIVEEIQICDGLVKKLIKAGDGESPVDGQICTMHYTGCLQEGDEFFDSSRKRDEPFEFTLGMGHVIRGWDLGVVTMKRGEECILSFTSELGYGAAGAGGAIPPNADLNFHVELLDFHDKPKELMEMSEAEKMTYAEEQKRLGNEALKEGNPTGAARCYLEGLKGFDAEAAGLEDLKGPYYVLKKALHSNASIALLKANNPMEARMHAQAVLTMDVNNVKAAYNFAQACDALGDYQAALSMIKVALESNEELTEKDKQMFQRQAAPIKQRQAAQDKKERATYAKMFA